MRFFNDFFLMNFTGHGHGFFELKVTFCPDHSIFPCVLATNFRMPNGHVRLEKTLNPTLICSVFMKNDKAAGEEKPKC